MKKVLSILTLSLSLYANEFLIGTIKPIYDVELSVLVDGVVSKVFYKEGDFVKKGDALLQLDDTLQTLETKRREIIYKDRIKIEVLEENLDTMGVILDKKERLYKDAKAVSLNELEQMKMQYANLRGEYLELKNSKKKEKIEYEISAKVLDFYTLKSPVDAKINTIKPKLGEWLQTGDKVIRIIDSTICFVELDIEASLVKSLSFGQSVEVEVSYNDKVIKKEAKIDFISNIADSASELFRVKVSFENRDREILPGVSAKIYF